MVNAATVKGTRFEFLPAAKAAIFSVYSYDYVIQKVR